MATKKATKGKWTSETLGEEEITDKVMWRAQRSVAPDGKVFYGVRKVIKKADGTELMGKDGMSFMVDDENMRQQRDQIMKVINCFQVLNSQLGLMTAGGGKKAKKVEKGPFALVDGEADDDAMFLADRVYDEDSGKYKVKTTPTSAKAKHFTSRAEAENWLMTNRQTGLHSKWIVTPALV